MGAWHSEKHEKSQNRKVYYVRHSYIHTVVRCATKPKRRRKKMAEQKPSDIKPGLPINEGDPSKLDPRFMDLKMALAFGIVYAVGLISGVYLQASGFFG
jgi:hypothetical protein